MPNICGIGMIKEIRSYNNTIKIVVVSSIVNSQVLQEIGKLRASMVKKPVKQEKLLSAINS
ncbi:MAG: two-component SAPR family response regulator [Sulfurimonas sp.]|jgi:two-component SAPR family response regulator